MTNAGIVERLTGFIFPVTTPFNRRGGIDAGALRQNISRYLDAGASGLLVAGSTGETPYLTEEERLRIVEVARGVVKAPALLVAGTGLEATAQTLRLSREAIARGADAVLVLPPDYYKSAMQPALLETHFRKVADGIRRPLLIYSIPQFTGFAMDPAMIGRLSHHPNIPGMKESSGNLDFLRAVRAKAQPKFRLLMGSALSLAAGLELGASGAILSQADFEPQVCLGVYEAFRRGDRAAAEKLSKRLAILVRDITAPYGVAGIKAAMDLAGYRGGKPRPPLMPVNPAAQKKIAAALKKARAGLDV